MNKVYVFLICFRPELFLESLVNPIPRIVYDDIMKYSNMDILLSAILNRVKARDFVSSGRIFDVQVEGQSTLKNVSCSLPEKIFTRQFLFF